VRDTAVVCAGGCRGACEVGFVESPTVPRGLHSTTVAVDRLVVTVPPTHPWSRRRTPLSVAELAATPLVVREPGSGTRTTLDLALRSTSGRPRCWSWGAPRPCARASWRGPGPR